MSKKMAEGIDALVLDVKVGTGAFMKKQVDARRLAQTMVGIGRRMDKKVQALITDMNQPLGYAIGNALEVMEVSQTLQNAGPADLDQDFPRTGRAHDLPRQEGTPRSKKRASWPKSKLVDGSAYKQIQAGGGGAGRKPAGARQVRAAAQRYRDARNHFAARRLRERIKAEDIGASSNMMGAGRDKKEDAIDPAVGIILEVKMGEKVDAGSVLCRLYYTQGRPCGRSRRAGGGRLPHLVAEARRAGIHPGSSRLMGRFTGILGLVVILGVAWLFSTPQRRTSNSA